jgi:hypothetical protein
MGRSFITQTIEQGIIWLVLAVSFVYSYAQFAVVPYAGFTFSRGLVLAVYEPGAVEPTLQVGERTAPGGAGLVGRFCRRPAPAAVRGRGGG